jgi:hypothetical protein
MMGHFGFTAKSAGKQEIQQLNHTHNMIINVNVMVMK